jgi:16S rRNA (uracil1498-N3)-methyltransferase
VRITRLYHPEKLTCGDTTNLDTNASNHLIRVLRTSKDSPVILFNGDGFDYSCRTLDENPKKTLIAIESKAEVKSESHLKITLLQGLSRQDRMEATIQKSVELGVNKIIPVLCQRSNAKLTRDKQIKKISHWQNVVISACEQSGRSVIPEITDIISLNNVIPSLEPDAYRIILNPEVKTSLKEVKLTHPAIEIFIGPEGGLNNDEISFLAENNFENICFGPRILRTETAGPAVISALQMLWGDF